MYCCDENELEAFILKVRELAKKDYKLALLAINPEDGRLAADLETLPKPKNCKTLCCATKEDDFPPLDLPVTKIKRSLGFTLTTFENSPPTTMFCGVSPHGRYICYPPW